MKGRPSPAGKRRWRGPPMVVFSLVFLSLLVPLGFLLGTFRHGNDLDDAPVLESRFVSYAHLSDGPKLAEGELSMAHKQIDMGDSSQSKFGSNDSYQPKKAQSEPGYATNQDENNVISSIKEGPEETQQLPSKNILSPNVRSTVVTGKGNIVESSMVVNENGRSCLLEFGSYCLWAAEHREDMNDFTVKKLKDQLFIARAYYPSIVKLNGQENLSRELKQKIQEHEHMLSDAIVDDDLPPNAEKNFLEMEQSIAKAKSGAVECNNVDKKLRQILDLTEDETYFHLKQSAFIYQMAVETMPKTHHCLSMRLTVEYFKSWPLVSEEIHANQIGNPGLRHIVIFSKNILATSVVVSSTLANSKVSGNMVFHVLTDVQNYYAMKIWFSGNTFRDAIIHVVNLNKLCDDFHLRACGPFSSSTEFRVSVRNCDENFRAQTITHYLSVLGNSHFLLPEIFTDLKRVVVLDDDIVVQSDLSSLWNLDLKGSVIGAVESCGIRLHPLRSYFGVNDYDGESCMWMSGISIVDLDKWREYGVTKTYLHIVERLQSAELPATILAFHDLLHPLNSSLIVSGLGYNYGLSSDALTNASVLHYNGIMKPWLDLGIPKYKNYWSKHLPEQDRFMLECNLIP